MHRGEKMRDKKFRVPEKCPLIEKCMELVDEDEFRTMCLSSMWVYCEAAKEGALKYKKRPVEWEKEGVKEE